MVVSLTEDRLLFTKEVSNPQQDFAQFPITTVVPVLTTFSFVKSAFWANPNCFKNVNEIN